MRDFFISYSTPDMAWADWLAWELEASGYEVFMQRWDFAPGTNFVQQIQKGVQQCQRLLLVLSRASLDSKYVSAEWSAFFASDPDGTQGRLIPVRVDDCDPPGLLSQIVYIDLQGTDEPTARARLLEGLSPGGRRRPTSPPTFPGIPSAIIARSPPFPPGWPPDVGSLRAGDHQGFPSVHRAKLPSLRRRQLGRAFVTHYLPQLIEQKLDQGRRFTLISLDVDGMTLLNQKYGIGIGDAVIERLIFFCEILPDRFVVARTGDDTLLVVLKEQTLEQTVAQARSLVETIATHDWDALAADLFVHCSAGVAEFRLDEDAFQAVLRAQHAQMLARRTGGNRVTPESDLGPEALRTIMARAKVRQMSTT